MFGKRKVLKDGQQAQAVITEAKASGYTNSKGIRKYHLELRVQFDDGSTGEASCSAYPAGPVSAFRPGEIVPVRFSAKDRTEGEVDHEAMVSAAEANRAAGREGLIRMAEEKLARESGGEPPKEF
jgi:hypothetical protein